jgi:hypothetical protein
MYSNQLRRKEDSFMSAVLPLFPNTSRFNRHKNQIRGLRQLNRYVQSPLSNQESAIVRVKSYFESIFLHQKEGKFTQFPSVRALASFLQTSPKSVIAALDELRKDGFDYEILNKQGTVLVWDKLLLSAN